MLGSGRGAWNEHLLRDIPRFLVKEEHRKIGTKFHIFILPTQKPGWNNVDFYGDL
jgi:hypothetical protein